SRWKDSFPSPMLFKTLSAGAFSIDAYLVEVEMDVGSAYRKSFNVVGLPNNAAKEPALLLCLSSIITRHSPLLSPPSAPLTEERAVCYPYNAPKIALFCTVTERMAPDTKHLKITLETQVESVNLAEEMCLRLAEAAGFGEDECYRIGMSVREGVINAFHYGNKEKPEKKIHLAVDLTAEKMIIHVADEGSGFLLKDVPDPLAEANLLSTSGRGIFLIRAAMDEFDVGKAETGGAKIKMSKRPPGAGSPKTNGNGTHGSSPQKEG